MAKISAGLLMYMKRNYKLEVFLVHPGGPYWKDKDEGAWGIPKGEVDENEELFEAAKREFNEEIGFLPKAREFIYLGEVKMKSGKSIRGWAFEGDWNGLLMTQSYVTIEYPYKSGRFVKIPEIDKASFFSVEVAKKKINSCQKEFIERLEKKLGEK